MQANLTIIIADDHPLFRGALKQALTEKGTSSTQIIEAGDFEEVQAALTNNGNVDLVLLDLAMPGVSGFSGLISLRAQFSDVPLVIVSASEDAATIRRALELGASGFIPKSSGMDEIRSAIDEVLMGNIWTPSALDLGSESDPEVADLLERMASLTPQQARVLSKLGQGLLNKQIAYELSVSEATVKAHVSAVLQKLNVDSRTQAVIRLAKIGGDVTPGSAVSSTTE